MATVHELLGGKVQVFKRSDSPVWHCRASVGGAQRRASTKQAGLAQAKDFAEDWFLELQGKNRWGGAFAAAADKFLEEYEVITLGERNPLYVKAHGIRVRVHLLPFFGKKRLSEITPGLVQEYRAHRMSSRLDKDGIPRRPSRSTMHQEIVTLRQILKTAERHGWIDHLPNLAAPYRANSKISHRGWFSPMEYKQLYSATRDRIKTAQRKNHLARYEQLHDFVLFMANTGLRPDEALRLEFRDVAIVTDEATGERILEIEVRGKRGVGYCKSMPGAVMPFQRLKKRGADHASELVFPYNPHKLLNRVLAQEGLKKDRDGQARTAYSLRHTYICLRLMEGADIYQIAKNCRTSVEMIEKYYASHLKNTLDAAAINVKRAKPKKASRLLSEA